ncbi:MAG: M23 family metallopeptidase [Geminicoccaceae bacterium]
MRGGWAAVLFLGLVGCTAYQPLDWDGRGSWAEARQLGNRPTSRVAASGLTHEVAAGETLSEIAVRYRVPLQAVADLNGIRSPYRVVSGQTVALPAGATKPKSPTMVAAAPAVPKVREPSPPVVAARSSEVKVASLDSPRVPAAAVRPVSLEQMPSEPKTQHGAAPLLSGDGFLWPVRGRIVSAFGSKPNGTRNDGINILVREGTPVVAAENGVVVYAGTELPGYGRMLLLSHADGFVTAYAHNSELYVGVGDRVERGQRIAAAGKTGNVTSPQLHFEIRDGKKALDPVALLDAAVTRVASVE